MKLSLSTSVCPTLSLPKALAIAAQAGFKGIELFRARTDSVPVLQPAPLNRVRSWIKDSELTLTGLNICDLAERKSDTGAHDPAYNLHQLQWDIHLALALGLRTVNVRSGPRSNEFARDLIDGVASLLDNTPDMSINLACHKSSCLETIDQCIAIMRQLDLRAKVLLDTGQLIAADQDVTRFAETFAGRIGLVHLRDQKNIRPVPVGQGALRCGDLCKVLVETGYRGHLVVALEQVTWDTPLGVASTARRYIEGIPEFQ